MATYNGERFVREQIESILPQLGGDDELIVVDDASTDGTVSVIEQFRDPRIHLFRHAVNQGVIPTFEEALLRSSGDILFLSDMDDRWASTKVARFMEAFDQHPEADLVISGIEWMNTHGTVVSTNKIKRRVFTSGFFANVIENTFQGSAMAMRKRVLGKVLPLPRCKLFLHDVWIGTRISIAGGSTVFLPEPLLFYRRHEANLSNRLTVYKKILLRLQLLWAHWDRWF